MKKTFVIGLALLISACQTAPLETLSYKEKKVILAKFVKTCTEQGYGPTSPEHNDCVRSEIVREGRNREDNALRMAGVGDAINRAGDNYNRSLEASRPLNCTTTGGYHGGAIYTNCY